MAGHEQNTKANDDAQARDGQLPEPPVYVDPYDEKGYERAKRAGYYSVMFAGDYEWSNERCTAEAYGEYDPTAPAGKRRKSIDGRPRRSLKFHTEWMDTDEAVACINEIPQYNKFTPEVMGRVLETSLPSNTQVVVGRESSVVMYFWTVDPEYVMRQLAGLRPGPESDATLPGWAGDAAPDELGAEPYADRYPLRTVGKSRDAPEVGPGVPTLVRAWWD